MSITNRVSSLGNPFRWLLFLLLGFMYARVEQSVDKGAVRDGCSY